MAHGVRYRTITTHRVDPFNAAIRVSANENSSIDGPQFCSQYYWQTEVQASTRVEELGDRCAWYMPFHEETTGNVLGGATHEVLLAIVHDRLTHMPNKSRCHEIAADKIREALFWLGNASSDSGK